MGKSTDCRWEGRSADLSPMASQRADGWPSVDGRKDGPAGRTTRVARHVAAPRRRVYEAFVDPGLLAAWLAPGTMRCIVHGFEGREGGRFRISLVYDDPADGPGGKTTPDTDTFHGRFARLVPDERVVQVVVFESERPGMAGEMRVTWALADAGGGTDVTVVCEDVPPGIRLEDNETGSEASLQNLARLVEGP